MSRRAKTQAMQTDPASFSDRVKDAFFDVLESSDRPAALQQACGDDAELRSAVQSLLDAQDKAGGFLHDPTITPPPPIETLSENEAVGPYRIVRRIGEGGFGVVYEARQDFPLKRTVALKIIKAGMDSRQVIARFMLERQALAVMDHPGIARVFDAGTTLVGRPYFVMEFVDGVPITQHCDDKRLSVQDRLDLFCEVCQAVQHAHGKGVIHRDIKPGNVLVTVQDGKPRVKVIDFGIAKAVTPGAKDSATFTDSPQFIGTPEYMSPEQAAGSSDVDTRTDVYGLGVLLYELLTGATPFDSRALRSKAYDEMRRVIRETDPPKPSTRLGTGSETLPAVAACRNIAPARLSTTVKGELDWIVMRAMEKDRRRRYATADALAEDLRRYRDSEPVAAGPPSAVYRIRKFARRQKALVASTLAIVVALSAGLAVAGYGLVRAQHERDNATRERISAEHERDNATKQRDIAARERDHANEAERRRALAADQAEQSGKFLGSMFTSLDPNVTRGRPVLVTEILDNAVKQVDTTPLTNGVVEAQLRSSFGQAYWALGKLDAAREQLEKSIELYRAANLTADPFYIQSMHIDGDVLNLLGHFNEAKRVLDEAMKRQSEVSGAESVDAAEVESSLAETVGGLGDSGAAVRMHRHALGVFEKVGGAGSLAVIKERVMLANLSAVQGNYARAEKEFREVLKTAVTSLGADHVQVIDATRALATTLYMAHKPAESLPVAREALKVSRRVLGENHLTSLQIQTSIASTLAELQQVNDAQTVYKDVLKRLRENFGEDHPTTLQTRSMYAEFLMDVGQTSQAIDELRVVSKNALRRFGPTNELTIKSNGALAWALMQTGEYQDAAERYRELLPQAITGLGKEHPYVTSIRLRLGMVLSRDDKFEEAEPLLKQAYDDATTQGRTSRYAGYAQAYGWCLINLNKAREALPLLLECNAINDAGWSYTDKMDVWVTCDALVAAYTQLDDKPNADKYRKKRDAVGPVSWPGNIARRIHTPPAGHE